MKTVRFGIIGCGVMRREFAGTAARCCHLPEMTVRPEIVAICDTDHRKPATSIYEAVACTAPGIVAHQSALQDGALLESPGLD
jgi:predicted dehydrogenase